MAAPVLMLTTYYRRISLYVDMRFSVTHIVHSKIVSLSKSLDPQRSSQFVF